eukprot:52403-Pleurochrysis_carterae.AAC.2
MEVRTADPTLCAVCTSIERELRTEGKSWNIGLAHRCSGKATWLLITSGHRIASQIFPCFWIGTGIIPVNSAFLRQMKLRCSAADHAVWTDEANCIDDVTALASK